MSIVVLCPHCKTRFSLQEDLNGKTMRCLNLECRQSFTVRAMEATGPAPEPPPQSPTPAPSQGANKPAAQPTKPGPFGGQAKKSAPPSPKPTIVEAEIIEAAIVSTPKVKEVVWSEGTDVPDPKAKKKAKKPAVKAQLADDDAPNFQRKRKRNRGPLLLVIALVGTVGLVVFGAFVLLRQQAENETKLAAEAEAAYKEARYAEAAKKYSDLAAEYPSSKDIEKYRFFAELAAVRETVRPATVRENYTPALVAFKAFVAAQKESPFAKPVTGYAFDILDTGKKLAEDIAAHAEDRVGAFRGKPSDAGELQRADAAIADGRELLKLIEPFRGPDDSLDNQAEAFLKAEQAVKAQRDRLAALAEAKKLLETPSDAIIAQVEKDLAARQLLNDPDAQAMLAEARKQLRTLIKYEDDPAVPQPPPPTAAASVLFVTRVGDDRTRDRAATDPPPTVFLCVARGILYAFDEDTGEFKWAARVGPDVTDPPAVARVELETGPADLAVVTSNVGNAPALSGHVLRTGQPRWYQPLPAPAAGPAVVVGTRAFVPLKDAAGTVYVFDTTTGNRVGRIRLGQTIADRGTALRPGTTLLYVAADARRLFVIDAGGVFDGDRVNPRCVQILGTGHLPGTIRVPPLFIGPEGTEQGERLMLLAQADGTATTRVRGFKIGAIPTPPADGSAPNESPASASVNVAMPGWVWFPPAADGERVAIVSDTGQFRMFGVNQVGNLDPALFPIPAAPLPPPPGDRPSPGLVIPIEEATYWLLAAGRLQKARLALTGKGQEVVLTGEGGPLGEPIHAAQLSPRRDAACVVVRSPNSSGCRAVLFDLRTGGIRWQRQLGLVPARTGPEQFAAPVPQAGHFILVDEDGGIVAVPTNATFPVGQARPAPDRWLLAAAPPDGTGPTAVAATPDGSVVYTVTPIERKGAKFLVRRVAGAKVAKEDEVIAPASIAGQVAIVGDSLLVPTADGFVNRFVPGSGPLNPPTLVPGPAWQSDRKPANPVCTITPLSASSFATGDGGKKLVRWEWPNAAGGRYSRSGEWELGDAVAGPGLMLPPAEPGGAPRLVVADVTGGVWMYPTDRAGAPKRWRGGGGVIPAGRPSSGFVAQAGTSGPVVAYVVDGKAAAAIDPTRDDPLWAARTGDDASAVIVGAPQPAGNNRWVVTDLAGRLVLLDGATGAPLSTHSVGLPGAVPFAASGVASDLALTPLSDGSAVVVELPRAAPMEEK